MNRIKKGWWIRKLPLNVLPLNAPPYLQDHVCSQCKELAYCDDYCEYLTNYCPYCGAKMMNANEWWSDHKEVSE